jgi:hypothetical protein
VKRDDFPRALSPDISRANPGPRPRQRKSPRPPPRIFPFAPFLLAVPLFKVDRPGRSRRATMARARGAPCGVNIGSIQALTFEDDGLSILYRTPFQRLPQPTGVFKYLAALHGLDPPENLRRRRVPLTRSHRSAWRSPAIQVGAQNNYNDYNLLTWIFVLTPGLAPPASHAVQRKGRNDQGAITLGLYPRRNGRT